jgi:DNA polymerase (family X)
MSEEPVFSSRNASRHGCAESSRTSPSRNDDISSWRVERFDIAAALLEIARRLDAEGQPRHRVRAYRRGAHAIEACDGFDRLLVEDRLTELPGIGKKLAALATEMAATGRAPLLERLRAQTPPAVVEMAVVPGVGMARARRIHAELGIESLDDLEAAASRGELVVLRGFGPRTVARILAGIERHRREGRRILLTEARELSDSIARFVAATGWRVEIGGPVRRWCETVDSLALAVEGIDQATVLERVSAHSAVSRRGDALFAEGLPLWLFVGPRKRFGRALVEATGSQAHVAALKSRVDWASIEAENEEALYRAVGLPWLPPEVREGCGEIEAIGRGELRPASLVSEADVRGMVHCHTVHSDGLHDVLTMARGAEAMGMDYVTITDHSPTAHYAGGLSPEALRSQWNDIEAAASQVRIDILRGTESDILPDGSFDYDQSILSKLDVIIASIHSRNRMDGEAMTARLIALMKQPMFKIWGHALGRLLLHREPIACDLATVLEAAAAGPVAIEVNGDPRRLDLPPEHIRAARRLGVPFVISTDAHSVRGMRVLPYAVAMARRGWLTAGEVLNTREAGAFREAVRPRR